MMLELHLLECMGVASQLFMHVQDLFSELCDSSGSWGPMTGSFLHSRASRWMREARVSGAFILPLVTLLFASCSTSAV